MLPKRDNHEDDMFIPMISRVSEDSAEIACDLLKARCGVDYFEPYAPESHEAIIAHFLREQPEGNYFQLAAWLRILPTDEASYSRFGSNPNSGSSGAVALEMGS